MYTHTYIITITIEKMIILGHYKLSFQERFPHSSEGLLLKGSTVLAYVFREILSTHTNVLADLIALISRRLSTYVYDIYVCVCT